MSKYGRRKDKNHNAITSYALEIGFVPYDTSRVGDGFPDSLMAFRIVGDFWITDLWEIKDGKNGLTPDEHEFFETYPGPKCIIKNHDDALKRREYWLQVGQRMAK